MVVLDICWGVNMDMQLTAARGGYHTRRLTPVRRDTRTSAGNDAGRRFSEAITISQ